MHNVKFLIIGGYAVNFHGYPRYTKDMDFWIWLNPDNVHNLMKALKDFGFGSVGLTESDFMHPTNIIQLGYEPLRIDILMELEQCNFEECYQRRTQINFDDVIVDFLNIDDLIDVKKTAGRLQDLADAENLEKIKKKKI